MDSETIIIDGDDDDDVVVVENLLKMILNSIRDATVFYDLSIAINADHKVVLQDGKGIVMSIELNEFLGEYIGITKFLKVL